MDGSPSDSSGPGIFQARVLEWVAISFSRGSSWPRDRTCISCIGRQILHHGAMKEIYTIKYVNYFLMKLEKYFKSESGKKKYIYIYKGVVPTSQRGRGTKLYSNMGSEDKNISGVCLYKITYNVLWTVPQFYVLCAKSLQSCLTLCGPTDCSPPGSSVHGILQARLWSGLLHPAPGNLPHPDIKPMSLRSPALTGNLFTTSVSYCLIILFIVPINS